MCCKGDESIKVDRRSSQSKPSNIEFDNLSKCKDESENLPTPNRFKHAKEEDKSFESSSKMSSFPAVIANNKDTLKNILNSMPKKNNKVQVKPKGLKREPKQEIHQQSALGIPEEKVPKKGKSFSKKTDKLDENLKKKEKEAMKNKRHQKFGDLVHRRFTFGLKNRSQIIINMQKNVMPEHRGTFTKNIPPLIRLLAHGNNRDTNETKFYNEGKFEFKYRYRALRNSRNVK